MYFKVNTEKEGTMKFYCSLVNEERLPELLRKRNVKILMDKDIWEQIEEFRGDRKVRTKVSTRWFDYENLLGALSSGSLISEGEVYIWGYLTNPEILREIKERAEDIDLWVYDHGKEIDISWEVTVKNEKDSMVILERMLNVKRKQIRERLNKQSKGGDKSAIG